MACGQVGEFSTASSSNLSFPHRGRGYARVFHNKIVGNPRVIRRVYPHLCTTMWITFLVFALSHGVLKTVFRRGESILETVFGTFSVSLAQTRKIGPQNRFSRFMVFLRVPLRNSPQSSAPTDPLTKGSHEESNVSNPLPRRIHQNPPEQPKTALFGKSVQKVPFFVSQKRCVSWCCFA